MAGDLTPTLRETDWWRDEQVAAAGIPIEDAPIVSVGSGIGSFVFFDTLRIAGLPSGQIRVLGNNRVPWQTYEYLTRVSQIPRGERLRSDSSSTPDCIWGFPGYSVREAFADRTLKPLWNVLTEPIWNDYYTPRAGQAFRGMESEANRVGYFTSLVQGEVAMVRRRVGGGYFSVLTPKEATAQTRRVAYRSRFVHLAVGYPGLTYLPDLQEYRQRTGDVQRVVNAYEPHEHVYRRLEGRPSVVLVRGGGIVASRVLQRLMDDREAGKTQVSIVHAFRTYVDGPTQRRGLAARKGGHGFSYQGFNWPKACWGGQYKAELEKLEGEERAAFYSELGGTTTPWRRSWQRQMDRAKRDGWYHPGQGVIESMTRLGEQVRVSLASKDGTRRSIDADAVIDCTGLEGDLRSHRLLADLLDHGGAGRNPIGRLDVGRHFEVRGAEASPGRMYAAGSATLGGYFAAVDTFLGLQYAALKVADDLARQGFCKKIGVGRSVSEWMRWAGHLAPNGVRS